MPELPSNGNSPRQRRNARRRAAAGATPKRKTPLAPTSNAQEQARISRPTSPQAAARADAREAQAAQSTDEASAQPEAAAPGNAGRGMAAITGKLSPLARQILLWGAAAGTAVFLLSVGEELLVGQIAPEPGCTQHQAFCTTAICLSDVFTLGLLALAGMRAVARMGTPKHGGLAGAWGAVVAFLLGLVVSLIFSALQPQQASASDEVSAGQVIFNILAYVLFNMALGFAAGWIGGRYSEWKRNKAQRQQEAPVAP